MKWAKGIDHTRCIGCHACTTACKSENLVPLSVTRTYVKHVDVGCFPRYVVRTRLRVAINARMRPALRHVRPLRCSSGRMGSSISINRSALAARRAWPLSYDAIFINPEDHSAEKMQLLRTPHRCGFGTSVRSRLPNSGNLVGDMNDTESYVSQIINREAVAVRRPEKETLPKLFYKGAHQRRLIRCRSPA